MKENQRKCFKCGRSASDPDVTLFRFPTPGTRNFYRCEIWAKYCFPDRQWHSKDFQKKLNAEHRMLCNRHFKPTSFSDWPNSMKKLHKFAVPEITSPEEVSKRSREVALNMKIINNDHTYVFNPNKTMILTLCSHDGERGLHMPDIHGTVPTTEGDAAVNHTSSKLATTIDVTSNDDPLQFTEDTQVESNNEYTVEDHDEGPFSWQKSSVVPCDIEEVVSSELIDDDVLFYDSKTNYSHAAQDTFTEEANEVLEELKCNLCENIVKGEFRYSCVQCPDFDLCGACEAKGAHRMHYVLRSPPTKTLSEIQLTMRLIRQTLLANSIVSLRDQPDEDEVKVEVEEGPEPGSEEDDPLSGDVDPADTPCEGSQELSLDECSDTGATESEEDESEEEEPPRKRLALSPFQSPETPNTFTLETMLQSTAKENQVLLEINPQGIPKEYLPVPDETKPMPTRTQMRPLIAKHMLKGTAVPLAGPSQQGYNSETPVSIQTFAGKRILLPITPSNIIVKDKINDNLIDPKTVPTVVKETKSQQLTTVNPSVRIEKLDVHTLNKYQSGTQTYR